MAHPRWHQIEQATDQIIKLRRMLGDEQSPADKIVRPEGMKRYLFVARVSRLKKLEKKVQALLLQELSRYETKRTKNGTEKTAAKRRPHPGGR